MSGDDLPLPPEGLTYYQLLGVTEDAPESDIQQAYRSLIKFYHPDKWNHWAADQVSKRFRDAYDTLTDPRARQRYNQVGHEEYTDEQLTSVSEAKNWITEVTALVDVDSAASPEDVTEGEQGVFDIGDEFDTEEEDVSATEIFEEVNEEVTPNTSWDEVQEDAEGEGEDDDEEPGYAGETDIANIERDNAKTKSRDISHAERVRETAENARRVKDPSALGTDSEGQEVSNKSEDEIGIEVDDFKRTLSKMADSPRGILDTLQDEMSDDVITKAVRKTWKARLIQTTVITFGLLIIGQFLPAPAPGIGELPSFTGSPANPNTIFLFLVMLSGVFIIDYLRSTSGNAAGSINIAVTPRKTGLYAALVSFFGVSLMFRAASRGYDPVQQSMRLVSGGLPVSVWVNNGVVVSSGVLNGIIAIFMLSAIVLGVAFSVWSVSRFVWYHRYVNGYRVQPLFWELIMACPVYASLMVLGTSLDTVPAFGVLEDAIESINGLGPVYFAVSQSSVGVSGLVLLATAVPLVVGGLLLIRVGIERGVRKLVGL